jgi:hypothetical protein
MNFRTYHALSLCTGNSARSLSLPISSIDEMRLQERMNAIGQTPPEAPQG